VFVGNLSFDTQDRDISDFFKGDRLNVSKVRLLMDQEGKSKGAAFVEFESKQDADKACGMNGKELGRTGRKLRINPAASKPSGGR
jgi:RNA recognition motif-containing protein